MSDPNHTSFETLRTAALPARAVERWRILPPTPAPIASERTGQAAVNGINVYYAIYGHGSPVILLHGGLANSDWWGNQIPALASHHTVIAMDSRGHGRSAGDSRPYSYDLMADDVIALMAALKMPKADVVGWGDGSIVGIDLAMRHRDRVGKIFAFAANTSTSGLKNDAENNPTLAAAVKRAGQEYVTYSATPSEWIHFYSEVTKMWADQPNWSDRQLEAITAPVLIVAGDHDEMIKRGHMEYIANTIPGAGLMILPNASHFAFLQDPELFNYSTLHFLREE